MCLNFIDSRGGEIRGCISEGKVYREIRIARIKEAGQRKVM